MRCKFLFNLTLDRSFPSLTLRQVANKGGSTRR